MLWLDGDRARLVTNKGDSGIRVSGGFFASTVEANANADSVRAECVCVFLNCSRVYDATKREGGGQEEEEKKKQQ